MGRAVTAHASRAAADASAWRGRIARYLLLAGSAALAICLLGACAPPFARGAATPTAVRPATPTEVPPTPTNVPAGWVVFVGPHFTIAYPKAWTYANGAVPGNAFGVSIVLQNASTGELLTIEETYGYTPAQLQTLCAQGAGPAQLAGLPMRYTLDAGATRTWYFVTSHHYAYALVALDAGQPPSVLAAHDAILATFRPDDPFPGCGG